MSMHYHGNPKPLTFWQRNLGGVLLLIACVVFFTAFWARWHDGIMETCGVGERCVYQPVGGAAQ